MLAFIVIMTVVVIVLLCRHRRVQFAAQLRRYREAQAELEHQPIYDGFGQVVFEPLVPVGRDPQHCSKRWQVHQAQHQVTP